MELSQTPYDLPFPQNGVLMQTSDVSFCQISLAIINVTTVLVALPAVCPVRQSKRHDEHRRAMAEAVRRSADESTYAQVEVIRSLENIKAGPKPQPSSDQ